MYFWSLGISLYLELFCFSSFISFVLRNLCSGTHRRNPFFNPLSSSVGPRRTLEQVRTIDLITFSNVSVCCRSNKHPSARIHFVSVFRSVSGVLTYFFRKLRFSMDASAYKSYKCICSQRKMRALLWTETKTLFLTSSRLLLTLLLMA